MKVQKKTKILFLTGLIFFLLGILSDPTSVICFGIGVSLMSISIFAEM